MNSAKSKHLHIYTHICGHSLSFNINGTHIYSVLHRGQLSGAHWLGVLEQIWVVGPPLPRTSASPPEQEEKVDVSQADGEKPAFDQKRPVDRV